MGRITSAIKKRIQKIPRKLVVEVPKTINGKMILERKTALIVGGNSGIGFAMARKFIEEGATVIIAGRDEQKLKECADKIENKNEIRTIRMDVTDVESMASRFKESLNLVDDHRIDILVNSAGIDNQHDFFGTTEEDYSRIMDINMKGTFFMSQVVAKYMIDNHIKGHILNLASSSSRRPAWNAYQISKWGIRGFTLGLADMLIPYGIVVNAIAPGPTATPFMGLQEGENAYLMHQPTHRYACPSEIADFAAYMVSDYGNLMVGDTYFISGGSGITTLHH